MKKIHYIFFFCIIKNILSEKEKYCKSESNFVKFLGSKKKNYRSYTITTVDGYILKLFRIIPNVKKKNLKFPKKILKKLKKKIKKKMILKKHQKKTQYYYHMLLQCLQMNL